MSHPKEPLPVKLIMSLFSADKVLIDRVSSLIVQAIGPLEWISRPCLFDQTRYYEKEMGWPLHRRFVSFRNLIPPEDLVNIKLRTNRIEQQHSQRGRRKINIDPGYVCKERLILATGKNYVHRVYLNKGVYADLTLVFERGSFRALPWTYPDYAETKMIIYFNNIRKRYITQLQETDDID